MKNDPKTLYVGFPLYDGVTLLDFCGPTEVFAFPPGPTAPFKPIWLAKEKKPVLTSEGASVYPHYSFKEDHPPIDILFIPGGHADGVIEAMFDDEFQTFIKETAAGAQWVGSVCVGVFILAASGLLKDCKATTYWSQLTNLSYLREKLALKIPGGNPRGVIDDKKKIFTGGGISSAIDLALMLVEKIKGKQYAERSQLYIQYAPSPPVHAGDPGQAPKKIVKELIAEEAGFTRKYYDAVQRLLQER
jgi:cyclohexyl-isocyanide hydratase